MRKLFADLAKQELASNDSVVVLLGDISMGLFLNENESLPSRCYNVGILEQSMISMAAGLASKGFLPIVHTISAFLVERSLEQIKLDLIYNNNKAILISANGPYDYSKLGPTHHSPNDVPLLDDIGLKNIFSPYSSLSFEDAFSQALVENTSSFIRTCKTSIDDVDGFEDFDNSKLLRNKKGLQLSIFVGEAGAIAFDGNHEQSDHMFIYDLTRLPEISKLDYEQIICWEPYGRPIVASRLVQQTSGLRITGMCYPKSIEDGIFETVKFLKIFDCKS